MNNGQVASAFVGQLAMLHAEIEALVELLEPAQRTQFLLRVHHIGKERSHLLVARLAAILQKDLAWFEERGGGPEEILDRAGCGVDRYI